MPSLWQSWTQWSCEIAFWEIFWFIIVTSSVDICIIFRFTEKNTVKHTYRPVLAISQRMTLVLVYGFYKVLLKGKSVIKLYYNGNKALYFCLTDQIVCVPYRGNIKQSCVNYLMWFVRSSVLGWLLRYGPCYFIPCSDFVSKIGFWHGHQHHARQRG